MMFRVLVISHDGKDSGSTIFTAPDAAALKQSLMRICGPVRRRVMMDMGGISAQIGWSFRDVYVVATEAHHPHRFYDVTTNQVVGSFRTST